METGGKVGIMPTYGEAAITEGTALKRFLDDCATVRQPMQAAVQALMAQGMSGADAWAVVLRNVLPRTAER